MPSGPAAGARRTRRHHRNFPGGSRVFYLFDLYGAKAHRLTLPLRGVEPGEYELLLTVTDKTSGDRLERRDVFVVDPA